MRRVLVQSPRVDAGAKRREIHSETTGNTFRNDGKYIRKRQKIHSETTKTDIQNCLAPASTRGE